MNFILMYFFCGMVVLSFYKDNFDAGLGMLIRQEKKFKDGDEKYIYVFVIVFFLIFWFPIVLERVLKK